MIINNNISKSRWTIIIAIGFVCLAVVLYTWYKKKTICNEYRGMVNQWNNELAGLRVAPTAENIFDMKKEYEWISGNEKTALRLLQKKRVERKDVTPLQFKEELLNTQIKLRQLADIQGCKLQGDIGFLEYASGEIPALGQVSVLGKQLTAVSELINILLRHRVLEIGSIKHLNKVYGDEDGLFKEIVFSIGMKCSMGDLLGILTDMTNAPYLFIVKNVKLQKIDGTNISAVLVVSAVEV